MGESPKGWPFYTVKSVERLDKDGAVEELLREEVVFVSTAQAEALLCVNTSDIFAWGYADAEILMSADIEDVYKAHKSGPWGITRWNCLRYDLQPQAAIRKRMKADGVWDDALEACRKNPDEPPE